MIIAVTGHSSAACLHVPSTFLGTTSRRTIALSPSILNTSGQVCTHKVQPIQISGSTFAFIVHLSKLRAGTYVPALLEIISFSFLPFSSVSLDRILHNPLFHLLIINSTPRVEFRLFRFLLNSTRGHGYYSKKKRESPLVFLS